VVGNRVIVLLILSYACLGYIYELFDSWIYYYFSEVRRFGAGPSAWFTGLAQATVLFSSPLGGWVSDYAASRSPRGRAWVAVTVLASSALLFFVGTRSVEMATTVGLFAAAFGLAASAEGGYWATAIQSCPASAASAYAVVNTGGNLGGLLAPVLLPALAARFGWSGGLLSACVAAAGAALGWLLLP
jgi:ACS family glucarate transporter-like MFS transporter